MKILGCSDISILCVDRSDASIRQLDALDISEQVAPPVTDNKGRKVSTKSHCIII